MAGNNRPTEATAIYDFSNSVDVYELATFGSIYPDDVIKPLTKLSALVRAWRDDPSDLIHLTHCGEMLLLIGIALKRSGMTLLKAFGQSKAEADDVSTEYHRQLALMSDDGGKTPPDSE